jgi:hypothetical protein
VNHNRQRNKSAGCAFCQPPPSLHCLTKCIKEGTLKAVWKKHSFTPTRQLLIIYFAAAIESNERGQRYARAENNGGNVILF